MTFPRGPRQRGSPPRTTPFPFRLTHVKGTPMSPYIFSADLATASETVRAIRAGLLVAQVDTSWEEATGSEGAELVLRAVIADRDGDHALLDAIRDRAAELDAEQPFGHRIVDEITAVISYPAAA